MGKLEMEDELSPAQKEMVALFEKHVGAELAGDLDTTMATMTDNPHLTNVASLIGGYGKEGVRNFYANHLVGKFFPPDVDMHRVSLTIGTNQIVEELVISFTHSQKIDWMLPGILPTQKAVKIALVVIVGFNSGKISHEHIYWDQASVLVQLGLLNPENLPVGGLDSALKILNPSLPGKEVKYPDV